MKSFFRISSFIGSINAKSRNLIKEEAVNFVF